MCPSGGEGLRAALWRRIQKWFLGAERRHHRGMGRLHQAGEQTVPLGRQCLWLPLPLGASASGILGGASVCLWVISGRAHTSMPSQFWVSDYGTPASIPLIPV